MLDGAAVAGESAAAEVVLAAEAPAAALALFAESLSPGPPALASVGDTIKPRTTAHVASARINFLLEFRYGMSNSIYPNT
jgi:hypothetical protein